EMLPDYLAGKIEGSVQNEEEVSIAYNISKEEELISFVKEDVHTAYNHIRGLISWPVGYGLLEGKRMKIHGARKVVSDHSHTLGEIVDYKDKAFWVACQGGYILITMLQPEGKGKMSAEQYYNGAGKSVIHKCFE
ncbi:MAG: methionyl-tRNA formyltransferase, partial [Erysipelotrichaceae bacterium]|nr:methionyl-tRNA formyltransferase [Erysipelotrichaceae bacterium]